MKKSATLDCGGIWQKSDRMLQLVLLYWRSTAMQCESERGPVIYTVFKLLWKCLLQCPLHAPVRLPFKAIWLEWFMQMTKSS